MFRTLDSVCFHPSFSYQLSLRGETGEGDPKTYLCRPVVLELRKASIVQGFPGAARSALSANPSHQIAGASHKGARVPAGTPLTLNDTHPIRQCPCEVFITLPGTSPLMKLLLFRVTARRRQHVIFLRIRKRPPPHAWCETLGKSWQTLRR